LSLYRKYALLQSFALSGKFLPHCQSASR